MKYYFCLLLFVMFHESLYSSCRIYSFLSHSLVLFVSDGQSAQADRLDVAASEDTNGSVSSPFMITGYGKSGEIKFNYVVGDNEGVTNTVALSLAMRSGAVRRELVHDKLMIEDSHYRISANKIENVYQVVVDNLDTRQLMAEAEIESSRILAEALTPNALMWPLIDGECKYRCSREECIPIMQRIDGKNQAIGLLCLKGALYQKGNEFLIRFVFSHEIAKGNCVAYTEGHVVGEFVDGDIKNSAVVYDKGNGKISVQVGRSQSSGFNLPYRDELQQELQKQGIFDRIVNLSLIYGERTMNLDLNIEFKNEGELKGSDAANSVETTTKRK